jgi:small-conductance mechanosensitive channel
MQIFIYEYDEENYMKFLNCIVIIFNLFCFVSGEEIQFNEATKMELIAEAKSLMQEIDAVLDNNLTDKNNLDQKERAIFIEQLTTLRTLVNSLIEKLEDEKTPPNHVQDLLADYKKKFRIIEQNISTEPKTFEKERTDIKKFNFPFTLIPLIVIIFVSIIAVVIKIFSKKETTVSVPSREILHPKPIEETEDLDKEDIYGEF